MKDIVQSPQAGPPATRFLPLLLLLFAGSGCSALIYEIVWYQMLQLAIGSTTVSLAFLLATYMAGLCIGSLWLPRFRRADQHPLKVYAGLEAGIALFGVLVLILLPLINRIYIAGVSHGVPSMLLRGIFASIILLPPTVLMGASLPAIVRWVKSTPQGVSWWGLLYGLNTVGAVFGCLFAGFYLMRLYDMYVTTLVAVAINLVVAAASYLLASRTPSSATVGDVADVAPIPEGAVAAADSAGRWTIYITIGLSGACALGAEVVWTRLMGMMLGATVYVFSIILAVFLIGLAMGSSAGSWMLRSVPGTRTPRLALGWCQILLAVAIAWTAYMISNSLPFWPINPLLTTSPWFTFQLDMVRCLWAILPPTLLWGASFPLALAAAAVPGEDPGRVVGGIYAANTLGAIVGALGISLIMVPMAGTQQSQRLLLMASALSALFVLAPYVRTYQSKTMAACAGGLDGFCGVPHRSPQPDSR